MEKKQRCQAAIEAIEDAILARQMSGHAHDKGLDWALELLTQVLNQTVIDKARKE